jgi:hypothetical protein
MALYFEIRLFDKKTYEPYGTDQYHDLRNLGSWVKVIEKCREAVREHILENRLLEAKLTYFGDLWPAKDGFGQKALPVKIWEADVIDPDNPRLGYKEQLFVELSDEDMEALGFVFEEQSPVSQRVVENTAQFLLS